MFVVKQFVTHVIEWNSSGDPVQELIIEIIPIGYVMLDIVIIGMVDTGISSIIFSLFVMFSSKGSNGLVTNDSLNSKNNKVRFEKYRSKLTIGVNFLEIIFN
jgi:hypothetical protein